MREYTFLAIMSVIILVLLDQKFKINILRRKEYYWFLAIIFFFKLLVNGYLTRFVVIYEPKYFLGIRLGTIPIEDFLFGFSMVTLAIIVWEFFKKGERA